MTLSTGEKRAHDKSFNEKSATLCCNLSLYFSYYRCWINGSLWIYKGPILVILVVCESLLTLECAHRPQLVCSIGVPFPITSPSLKRVTLKPLFIDWKDASRMLSVHFLINSFFGRQICCCSRYFFV